MGRMECRSTSADTERCNRLTDTTRRVFPFTSDEDAFDAAKWPTFDEHGLTHLHIRIRSDQQPRLNHSADPFNLGFGNVLRAILPNPTTSTTPGAERMGRRSFGSKRQKR